ncbi:cht-1, partial [Pristionchus pacificus]
SSIHSSVLLPVMIRLLLLTSFLLQLSSANNNASMVRNGPIDTGVHNDEGITVMREQPKYIRPCYFTNWAQYRNGRAKFMPEDYVPGLCTHILFAFGWMNEDFTVRAFDPADVPNDWAGQGMFRRINALKQKDPQLKTLLSIGGWSFGTALFKSMSATPHGRQKFIDSAIEFVRKWEFDGIDIDWEYPNGTDDMANYSHLIKELREGTEAESRRSLKDRLLVTAAVSGGEATITQAYDIPALAEKFDFILLMNYDFHGAWATETGHNSPLYARENMIEYQKVWNIDWAANHWAQKGMPKEKIIVGIATYGRGWTLKDPKNFTVGAAGTPARTTKFVGEAGVGAYYEFCEMLADGAKRHWDSEQQVPYLVYGDQWFGYDDEESVSNKIAWVKRNHFGGAFVWTLDFDDFNAKCSKSNGQPYPLISIIAKELGGVTIPKIPKSIESITSTTSTTTSAPTTTTASVEIQKQCEKSDDGFFPIEGGDCKHFLLCLKEKSHMLSCPTSLHFSTTKGYCVEASDSGCTPPLPTPPPSTSAPVSTSGQKFACNVDGFYADKTDCKRFFRCVGGTAHSFTCPSSLSFNKNTLQCDHPNEGNCARD